MAKRNFRGYLQGETVRAKKYLYVLRPLLAVRWIELRGILPPVEFRMLLDGVLDDEPLKREIEELLKRKTSGLEHDEGPRNSIVHEFCERELARIEEPQFLRAAGAEAALDLDSLFLDCLSRYAPSGF